MSDFVINYHFAGPGGKPETVRNDGLDALYARVQRFKKGDAVPAWLKRTVPPDPKAKITFARDCEVLRHESQNCSTIWPVEGFKRTEPRLYFEAHIDNGSDLEGDCQFFVQQRS